MMGLGDLDRSGALKSCVLCVFVCVFELDTWQVFCSLHLPVMSETNQELNLSS